MELLALQGLLVVCVAARADLWVPPGARLWLHLLAVLLLHLWLLLILLLILLLLRHDRATTVHLVVVPVSLRVGLELPILLLGGWCPTALLLRRIHREL